VEQTGTPCWTSESLNRANRPKQTHNDLKALGKKNTLSPWIFAGERIISSEMNRAGPSTQMRIGFGRLLDPVMRKNGSHLSARRQASELCVM
jgi:hypothetical protein